jgi:hypothetical protein
LYKVKHDLLDWFMHLLHMCYRFNFDSLFSDQLVMDGFWCLHNNLLHHFFVLFFLNLLWCNRFSLWLCNLFCLNMEFLLLVFLMIYSGCNRFSNLVVLNSLWLEVFVFGSLPLTLHDFGGTGCYNGFI